MGLGGTSLPPKHIVLTFDDGPGANTLALSSYLASEGIHATFFETGRCYQPDHGCRNDHALQNPTTIISQLIADGHTVANHTQNHPNLTSLALFPTTTEGNAALVDEVAKTDAIIAPYVEHNRFFFRAPFGAYDARVYSALQQSPMSKYFGNIQWEIGSAMSGSNATGYAGDWDCWENNNGFGAQTSRQCGNRYMNEITARGRGIVLMHDVDDGDVANADIDNGTGNTYRMVRYLVPLLKAAGYTFVTLEDVPDIAALLPPLPPVDAGSDGDASRDATDDHVSPPVDAAPSDASTSTPSNVDAGSPSSKPPVVPLPDPCSR